MVFILVFSYIYFDSIHCPSLLFFPDHLLFLDILFIPNPLLLFSCLSLKM